MDQDQLFERLWRGEAAMEEWTQAVAGGAARPVGEGIVAIHTGYLFGNATAIRTAAGLVLVDTGSRETASQILAVLRRWDDSPVHTVISTHGHIGARRDCDSCGSKGLGRMQPWVAARRDRWDNRAGRAGGDG